MFRLQTALGGLFSEYGLQPHNSNIIVNFFSKINVFPVHDLAEHHSRRCTGDRCQQRGTCDGRRIDAAVLAAVGDHVDGDQLQGRDVDDQKCTHLVAGGPGRALPSVRSFFSLQLIRILSI